jgi:small conductance mechanosensitive channel
MMDILIGNVSLDNFLIFILTFILTLVVGNVSYALMRRMLDDKLPLRYSKLIAKVTEYAVYAAGFSIGVYYVLRLDLKAFVASLGIIGIALAFASQQIIQNILAGILIAVNRPVQLDDWVEIGGGTGISNIKDITMTRTVLRDRSGRLFYIPNSVLISSIIINYTKSGFIELPISLKVSHVPDIEKIKNIIKDVANENPSILPNVHNNEIDIITKIIDLPSIKMLFKEKHDMSMFNPRIFISDLSESGIMLSIRIWIREINRKDEIISEFLEILLKKFGEEKIDLIQN